MDCIPQCWSLDGCELLDAGVVNRTLVLYKSSKHFLKNSYGDEFSWGLMEEAYYGE